MSCEERVVHDRNIIVSCASITVDSDDCVLSDDTTYTSSFEFKFEWFDLDITGVSECWDETFSINPSDAVKTVRDDREGRKPPHHHPHHHQAHETPRPCQ